MARPTSGVFPVENRFQVGKELGHFQGAGEVIYLSHDPGSIQLGIRLYQRFDVAQVAAAVGERFHDDQVLDRRQRGTHAR